MTWIVFYLFVLIAFCLLAFSFCIWYKADVSDAHNVRRRNSLEIVGSISLIVACILLTVEALAVRLSEGVEISVSVTKVDISLYLGFLSICALIFIVVQTKEAMKEAGNRSLMSSLVRPVATGFMFISLGIVSVIGYAVIVP